MTSTINPPQLWRAVPGWSIAADLTPPELINGRQLKLLRRLLAIVLVALVLICVGGYVLAARKHSTASDGLAQAQLNTVTLQRQAAKYAGVTSIQGTVTQVQTQIAQVMGNDVDLVKLMGLLRSNLPATMTIDQESVTINVAGAVTPTGGLDTSGLARIGTVTLSGTGRTLDDLPAYVDRLKVLAGVVDVMPNSNSVVASVARYGLTLGLTSTLLSHRFDVIPAGTK